jgi:hypothetical protein
VAAAVLVAIIFTVLILGSVVDFRKAGITYSVIYRRPRHSLNFYGRCIAAGLRMNGTYFGLV